MSDHPPAYGEEVEVSRPELIMTVTTREVGEDDENVDGDLPKGARLRS